jgi:hypothetical protein
MFRRGVRSPGARRAGFDHGIASSGFRWIPSRQIARLHLARHLPIQVEIVFDPVLQAELFQTETELALAEQLVGAKKRAVDLLRQLTYGGHRPETVKAPLG